MNPETKTPRTDAGSKAMSDWVRIRPDIEVVATDFARQLEIQLNMRQAELQELRDAATRVAQDSECYCADHIANPTTPCGYCELRGVLAKTGSPDQIWPSIESINLKCPRPHVGGGGYHWWYNDSEQMEKQFKSSVETDYVPIICKTCGLKLKLSIEAPEYPAI